MVLPYHCNPFFPRCKQNFQEFENFFEREKKKTPQPVQNFPNPPKNGPKPPAHSGLPAKCPDPQCQKIPQPQIPAAEGEAQVQPAVAGAQQEQGVCDNAIFLAQGPEKPIPKAQDPAQGKSQQQTMGSNPGGHPNRRRHPEAALGSS